MNDGEGGDKEKFERAGDVGRDSWSSGMLV